MTLLQFKLYLFEKWEHDGVKPRNVREVPGEILPEETVCC